MFNQLYKGTLSEQTGVNPVGSFSESDYCYLVTFRRYTVQFSDIY